MHLFILQNYAVLRSLKTRFRKGQFTSTLHSIDGEISKTVMDTIRIRKPYKYRSSHRRYSVKWEKFTGKHLVLCILLIKQARRNQDTMRLGARGGGMDIFNQPHPPPHPPPHTPQIFAKFYFLWIGEFQSLLQR